MKIFKSTLILVLLNINCYSQSESSDMKVKIGMTLDEVTFEYPKCELGSVEAWKYGVDGGGNGVEVKSNNEILFFFWTHWKTEKITGIVLVSPKLLIDGGVHVGMNFREFLKKHPESKTTIDLLTFRENCYAPSKNYWLEFDTNDDNRIAEYDYENGEPEFIRFIDTDRLVNRIILR